MVKVLILDTTKKLPAAVLDEFLEESFDDLVMYGENLDAIHVTAPEREEKITGRLDDEDQLVQAMTGVDYVFLDTSDASILNHVLHAIKQAQGPKLIYASAVGIYDEVPGKFGEWLKEHRGEEFLNQMKQLTDTVEQSGVTYTILRLPPTYTNSMNDNYQARTRNQQFMFTQVSREAVGRAITQIVRDQRGEYDNLNIALGEPGSEGDAPIFDPSRA
ncbi:NAD(P)H-binding protein [Ligilactobacillus saerimneri]|uniref:NAD-dependent epimerase n=1 Tax=Ligilactobacillus saerimneri 30a TaxID=1227363 RepID=M5J760_9LACO|nr:NAD(P)H-binding protein [Ligilactobacillus saerimneri]EKW99357.1 NAD-dependent epimerase [Ligilactobacillus saerimneri 30a]